MSTETMVDVEAVRAAVESVPDPELPPVTIGMLGMVHDVRVDASGVDVDVLPTFSGCPATEMIARDVRAAVTAAVGEVEVRVRFLYEPMWTPARIDATGRERLREFGITPPTAEHSRGAVLVALSPRPPHTEGRLHSRDATGGASAVRASSACPYCGSDETDTDSPFGPTPCRSLHYCRSCRQPFEAFKDL